MGLIFLVSIMMGEDFLVSVKVKDMEQIRKIEKMEIDIYEYLGDKVLVKLDETQIKEVRSLGYKVKVLDKNPGVKNYLIIRFVQSEEIDFLKTMGKIVLFDEGVVILIVKEKGRKLIKQLLKKGRWEVSRLNKLPIKVRKIEKVEKKISPQLLQELASQVVAESLRSYVKALETFAIREAGSENCRQAGEWLYNKFKSFGIERVQNHYYSSGYEPNVVAVLKGKRDTHLIYIVGAHYDAEGGPGAEDNASGVSVCLEVARILSKYKIEGMVKIVAFGAEEVGLVGSEAYAWRCRERNDSVIGVINLDMVGYNSGSYGISISRISPSEWMIEVIEKVKEIISPSLSLRPMLPISGSDHISFWRLGYGGIFIFSQDFTPYYHSPYDSSSTLDFEFLQDVAKITVATVAQMSGLVYEEVGYVTHLIEDDDGDKDKTLDPDEECEVVVWVKNFGEREKEEVKGILRCEDDGIVILDSVQEFSILRGGEKVKMEFKVKTANTLPLYGHLFSFELQLEGKDFEKVELFEEYTGGKGSLWGTHKIGDIRFSLTCRGESYELVYPNFSSTTQDYLTIGQLWVGNSDGYVLEGDDEWKETTYPDGRIRVGTTHYSDEDSWALYEARGEAPLKGIKVKQEGWAFKKEGYRKFIILNYTIKKEDASSEDSIYVGQFMSFSFTGMEKLKVDTGKKVVYVESDWGSSPLLGIKGLNTEKMCNISGINLSTTELSDGVRIAFLKGEEQITSGVSEDYGAVISYGPYSLEEEVKVSFAIILGVNLENFLESSEKAEEMYKRVTIEEEQVETKKFTLYPNPSRGGVMFKFHSLPPLNLLIEVYDIVGRLVTTFRPNKSTFYWKTTLTPGVYFVKLKGKGFGFTKKLIIF